MKMKDNASPIFAKWEKLYCQENDKLGGNSENRDFVEGWCIIENDTYVKTLDDVVGLLIFGYDDSALSMVNDWIAADGEEDNYLGFKLRDIKNKLKNYYEE